MKPHSWKKKEVKGSMLDCLNEISKEMGIWLNSPLSEPFLRPQKEYIHCDHLNSCL